MLRPIGKEFREVQQLLNRRIEADKADCTECLSHLQIHLLFYLSRQKQPVYQKDIEELLKVRRSTATQMLNVLERDEYVLRVRDESDARMKEIRITDKTVSLLASMKKHIKEIETLLRKNISDDDLDVFFRVVDQIKLNLE